MLAVLQTTSGDGAHWYYQGRGALTHREWCIARDAFAQATPHLRASANWPLVWLCLLAETATAWRLNDSLAAIRHAKDAQAIAQRLTETWPPAWSCWILGHLHAARGEIHPAANCFNLTGRHFHATDDHLMLGLATVAAALCHEQHQVSQSLSEQLFGLLRLSFARAEQQGLPLEPLYDLPSPPLFEAAVGAAQRALSSQMRTSVPQAAVLNPARPSLNGGPRLDVDHAQVAVRTKPTFDLEASCLGRFEVTVGGTPVTQWNGTKSKTLLKLLLAAHPEPVPCDKVMHAMWPNVEEELARQRLHTTVSDLRRVLRTVDPQAGSLIISSPDGYSFAPQARLWIDVAAFYDAQATGQRYETLNRKEEANIAYMRAAELYQGDFLEEDLYDDWAMAQREALKNAYVGMLTRLVQWAFVREDYHACVRWGQALLTCDAYREDMHQRLMQSYSRLRQRPQALRQYQRCIQALQQLDVVPETETEELYRRLQRGQEI